MLSSCNMKDSKTKENKDLSSDSSLNCSFFSGKFTYKLSLGKPETEDNSNSIRQIYIPYVIKIASVFGLYHKQQLFCSLYQLWMFSKR